MTSTDITMVIIAAMALGSLCFLAWLGTRKR